MNKAELIDAMAANAGLSKADAKRALDGFVDATGSALKKGDRISLVGFGSFYAQTICVGFRFVKFSFFHQIFCANFWN